MRRDQLETPEGIQKKITLIAVAETPGFILFGLGIYAKFAANGDAFHPLLNNENTVNIILGIGISIMAICAFSILKLSIKRNRLIKELSSTNLK